MSVESWCWADVQKCGGPINKFVLLTVCDAHCPENPSFGFNQKRIARKCELSLDQLWKSFRALEGMGLIISRRSRDGRTPQGVIDIDWFGFDVPVRGMK